MDRSQSALHTVSLDVGYANTVVTGIDIAVEPGRICTLIGPNGAGKSTILKTVARRLVPKGGTVYVGKDELSSLKASDLARTMALLTTERADPELMTCADVVALGRYPHTGRLGLLTDADWRAMDEAMALVGVADLAERQFSQLSDGQRQRVLFARAICQEPHVLVLDEPTSYLDIHHKLEFVRTLRRLARERSVAVLMSLHELELVRYASDLVVCVARGRIDRVAPPNEVFCDGYVRTLYGVDDDLFDELYPGLDRPYDQRPSQSPSQPPACDGHDERYVRSGQQRLRRGMTTGTCAALATAGATRLLLTGRAPQTMELVTPKGVTVTADLEFATLGDNVATCGIRKDAGDDPDVTNGIVVVANVSRAEQGITIEGGDGVGRVTKPGLDQPVGAAAINRVPRQMIEEQARAVATELGYAGGLTVTIEVPGGKELANRTFNPQLGVVGGISILGTTGIEEPMSEQALVDTIEVELRQQRALGATRVVLLPGNYAEEFVRTALPELANIPQVKFSNYLGDALDTCVEQGFTEVLVVGHIGKLVKLAGGIMNTHSKVADCRMELMCAHAAICGASQDLCSSLLQCATTDAALDLLRDAGLTDEVMRCLIAAMQRHLDLRTQGSLRVGAVVFSNQHGLLGETPTARTMLQGLA